MCGFVGFTGMIDAREAVLQRMMDRIVHRGPDMGGRYLDDGVALGFRRLSILDLSEAGAQPMSSEDGGVTVVFNGEIYNFMELRKELETLGHRFHCGADTEVLVHGYEEWGDGLVHRLRGMYGFVIWTSCAAACSARATSSASSRSIITPSPAARACFSAARSRASSTIRSSAKP